MIIISTRLIKNKKKNKKKKNQKKKFFFKYIENKSKGISYDLFKKYFDFETSTQLTKKLILKVKEKNNDFAKEIMNRWSKLKDEIKKMSKEQKEIEKPDKYLEIVEKILEFNKQNQQGKGLKILTPQQMLRRLTIALAQ